MLSNVKITREGILKKVLLSPPYVFYLILPSSFPTVLVFSNYCETVIYKSSHDSIWTWRIFNIYILINNLTSAFSTVLNSIITVLFGNKKL